MTISLYDATVASFQQTLGALSGVLERGLAHCVDTNIDPQDFVEARLFENMLPLRFQIQSVAHHSVDAIADVRKGLSTPATDMPPMDYAGLQKVITDARAALDKLTPADVNSLAGRDVLFQFREMKMPFTAEGFLLSFSIPNFHFHATTAYDILRSKGVPLGKRDYLGALRIKG